MLIVTGPNGNVGSDLVEELAGQDAVPYRIAAHTPAKVQARWGANLPVVKFDFGDLGVDLDRAL